MPLFSWRRVLTCKFAYKVALLRVLFLMSFVRLCSGIGILPVNFRIKVALVCLHVDCVALPLRDPYALRIKSDVLTALHCRKFVLRIAPECLTIDL